MTEETCLGEVAGSGHTAGLEGLIKGSELPGLGRVGLRQGLLLRVLAQEGVDVLNIKINKIKIKVSNGGGKQTETKDKNTKHKEGGPQGKAALSVRKDGNLVLYRLHTSCTAAVGWTGLKPHSTELLKEMLKTDRRSGTFFFL